MIIDCALFLREPEILKYGIWRDFSKQFIACYKDWILSFFGLEPKEGEIHRVPVNDYQLFLAVMLSLYRTGMFGGSQKELAEAISAVFDMPIKNTYLTQLLSGTVSEHERILDFFNNYKKYDF